ncbi:MAG: glutaredoxin 3 [Steroidobacteraceae bacterium]
MPTITIYGTQWCPYCQRAEQLLKDKGIVTFEKIAVDHDASERDKMIALTGRRTVPQIFIGDKHVGGFDDLAALDRSGQLDLLLAA